MILFPCANSPVPHASRCSTFLPSGERIDARPSSSSRLADSSPRPSIHPLPLADSDGRTRLVYRSGGANSGRSEISDVPPLGSKAEMGLRSVARGSSESWTSNPERPTLRRSGPCPALRPSLQNDLHFQALSAMLEVYEISLLSLWHVRNYRLPLGQCPTPAGNQLPRSVVGKRDQLYRRSGLRVCFGQQGWN